MRRHLRLLVAAATLAAWPMIEVQANPFDRLVVLGDSLSDIGNAGRFSNGPVWVEHLATRLGLRLEASEGGGTNYAVGGARLDPQSGAHSLRAQADRYLQAPAQPGSTLYVVFGGGNDLLAAVQHPQPAALIGAAVGSLRSIVADLAARGATDILVPNLPDVGITPAVAAYGESAMQQARRITTVFNAEVDRALGDVTRRTPGLRVHRLDVWSLAEQVRATPKAFGYDDIMTPCAGSTRCEGYLFWDQVHPTTQAHGQLGAAAFDAVRSVAEGAAR